MSSDAVSKRIASVPPSVMFQLLDKIRELESSGIRIVDLSLGQPDVPAPPHIPEAMQKALRNPLTSYSSPAGSLELRKLIAQTYTQESGVTTRPDQVIVTSGSKHALFISLISLLDPGEEILVPEPFFPPYVEITSLAGAKLRTVPVSTSDSGDFKLDLESLFAAAATSSKTKVLLINYPNNPAGWTLTREEVRKIVEFCIDRGIYFVSDEIYDRIVFDRKGHTHAWSISQGNKYIVGLGSFSKTYSMVPYRLGYVIANPSVCQDFLKAQKATITMVSPYAEKASVAALLGPQEFVTSRLTKYQERRDRCVSLLRRKGIRVQNPEGAFYLFIKMPEQVSDSYDFVLNFLERAHIALLPGSIFGKRWSSYVRISFATKDDDLYHAMEEFAKAYVALV